MSQSGHSARVDIFAVEISMGAQVSYDVKVAAIVSVDGTINLGSYRQGTALDDFWTGTDFLEPSAVPGLGVCRVNTGQAPTSSLSTRVESGPVRADKTGQAPTSNI